MKKKNSRYKNRNNKEIQIEGFGEMNNLCKSTGTTNANITNRMQEIEESQTLKI